MYAKHAKKKNLGKKANANPNDCIKIWLLSKGEEDVWYINKKDQMRKSATLHTYKVGADCDGELAGILELHTHPDVMMNLCRTTEQVRPLEGKAKLTQTQGQ
jgi:hypothetical protein